MDELGISDEAIRSLLRRAVSLSPGVGRDELREQIEGLTYVSGPVTMMDVRVERSRPAARGVTNPFQIQPTVVDNAGELIGGLLLWLDPEGYIDCVEYFWYTDEMPSTVPSANQLH